jgi:acetylornithine deacetylase/succinyl-diaminopimelate desuccinylase-like protein
VKAVAETIAEVFDRAAMPVLVEYAAIECLSPAFDADWSSHGELDRAAELLAGWCRERSVDAEIEVVRLAGHTPVIFAELPGDPARSTTLIYGHLDKQPALGPWREGLGAFTPVLEGDRLYGRGTADDGYATFIAFSALEAMAHHDIARGRVVVLIEASEESGSPDLEAYLDHLAPRIGEVALVICLDSGCATYDRLWVTTSLRGVLIATLTVSVLTEGVHSGHAGGIVPSSFRIARALLSRIEDERDGSILLPELHGPGLPPHRRTEIAEVAEQFGTDAAGIFPLLEGLVLEPDATERLIAGTWAPSLEITGAAGLPEPVAGGNVLRPQTTLKLSVRLPPNADAELAAAALRERLLDAPPAGAVVDVTMEQPGQGWDAPGSAGWLTEALRDASVEHFGAPPAALGLGGSIPFMAALGLRFPDCQFLATGVLGPESNAHGPNEFLHVPYGKKLTAAVADVIAAAP